MKKFLRYQEQDTLSYAEYGDPGGFPVLVQHGMIASINDGGLFQRLVDAGARVICAARPGYGDSSPYALRDIGEWGEVTARLVKDLGLSRFDVLGISSGAPYAYAVGHQFPIQARNVFILSGTPALFDETVLSLWPYPVDKNAGLAGLQELAYQLFFAHIPAAERENDDIRDSMAHHCFGIALDLKIRVHDWGFPLSGIQSKVYMRHSRSDGSVPFATAARTASLLPGCFLEARENDPHFSRTVLDDFITSVIIPKFG